MLVGNNVAFGRGWAQYLVDKGLVKKGDFVWMPVEFRAPPMACRKKKASRACSSRSASPTKSPKPRSDQAEAINRMVDYVTANRTKIKAMIGLGDLVTGSVKRVWDQAGIKPGEIPVVGWGNSLDTTQEVLTGYVNAGQWQDPQATSYIALSLANMESGGVPAGFDVITGALYEKDTAQVYDDILSGK